MEEQGSLGTPKRTTNRRLAVKVSGELLAIEVVLQIVLLSRALTHVANIAVRLNVPDQAQPTLARRPAVSFLVQPSVLYP